MPVVGRVSNNQEFAGDIDQALLEQAIQINFKQKGIFFDQGVRVYEAEASRTAQPAGIPLMLSAFWPCIFFC